MVLPIATLANSKKLRVRRPRIALTINRPCAFVFYASSLRRWSPTPTTPIARPAPSPLFLRQNDQRSLLLFLLLISPALMHSFIRSSSPFVHSPHHCIRSFFIPGPD